jgi:hypothetical protein
MLCSILSFGPVGVGYGALLTKSYLKEWIFQRARLALAEIINIAVSFKRQRELRLIEGRRVCHVHLLKATIFYAEK